MQDDFRFVKVKEFGKNFEKKTQPIIEKQEIINSKIQNKIIPF